MERKGPPGSVFIAPSHFLSGKRGSSGCFNLPPPTYVPSSDMRDPMNTHPFFWVYKGFWVVVSNIFHFYPYLGKISILTNIFQRGWNHQLGLIVKGRPPSQGLPPFSLCLFADGQSTCFECFACLMDTGSDFEKKHTQFAQNKNVGIEIWLLVMVYCRSGFFLGLISMMCHICCQNSLPK